MNQRDSAVDRRLLGMLLAVIAVLIAAGCADGDAIDEQPTTQGDDLSGVERVEVECAVSSRDDVRALATRQELAFDGTVTAIVAERNVSAGYQRALLDDGEEGPGEIPAELHDSEPDPDDPNAGEIWPWTTFEIHGWYTFDAGAEISIWTAGLDLQEGDRWLISGEAFATPDGLGDHEAQSGMAVVCASEPRGDAVAEEWDDWFGGTVAPGVDEPEGEPDPTVVAEIEAGRARWLESRTDSYTATMGVFSGAHGVGECGATAGSVRVVVDQGEVTDAVNIEQGCRIDPATTEIFTIDDLFGLAIRASAAAEEFGYEIDATYGYPSYFFGYDRSIELDGFVGSFTPRPSQSLLHDEIPQGINEMRARWESAGISDYRFELEWQCFCPVEVRGPFVITVVGSEQQSIERSDGGPVDLSRIPDLPETLDELFDLIEEKQGSSDMVIAGFDKELGFPTDVFVDEIENAVDDELTVVIMAFEAL